ncbi:MAG: hypothetical protein Q7S02_05985, partial [bacterium]|nr:hypothetical protein [bacterium]
MQFVRSRSAWIIFLSVAVLLGQGSRPAIAVTIGDEPRTSAPVVSTPSSTDATGVREVFRLNDAILAKQKRLEELQGKIEQYRKSIIAAQGQANTLQRRVATLEDRVAKKQLDIEKATTEREQIELEVQATRLQLEGARDRISRRRRLLTAMFVELRSVDAQPALHIVLAHSSVGAYFAHRNRLALAQDQLRQMLAQVRADREELESAEHALADRQAELQALTDRLATERTDLREEQDEKARLLVDTRSNERRYQQLVAGLKAEQDAIDQEIVAMETQVRKQLEAIDADFGKLGRVAFSWPVPNRGITAYFHDPEYPYRYVFEHPAIDIRASQGSPIRAAAPGYVARAKDAGYGYSYIMLIHPGGF